jgi:hypothetical protein
MIRTGVDRRDRVVQKQPYDYELFAPGFIVVRLVFVQMQNGWRPVFLAGGLCLANSCHNHGGVNGGAVRAHLFSIAGNEGTSKKKGRAE